MIQQSFLNELMGWYITLAVAYNLISLLRKEFAGRGFSPTDPAQGISIMAILYCVFLLQDAMFAIAALTLLISFTILVARFGILRHAVGYNREDYLSRLTWALAIGINVFGVAVVLAAVVRIVT